MGLTNNNTGATTTDDFFKVVLMAGSYDTIGKECSLSFQQTLAEQQGFWLMVNFLLLKPQVIQEQRVLSYETMDRSLQH